MGREKLSLPLGLGALDGIWGVASPLKTLSVKLRLWRKCPPGKQRHRDNGAGVGKHQDILGQESIHHRSRVP